MTATRQDIERWLAEGKAKGAERVLVACDTYDHDNYPVYVMPGESARERADQLGNMQTVDEVYDLAYPLGAQLMEKRARHWGGDSLWKDAPVDRPRDAGGRPNGEDGYDPYTCYRCWQVGRRDAPAVCLVTYNADSTSEWTSASCTFCLEADLGAFPAKTRVVGRL